MTDKEYKQMSIRVFSKAAKVYETDQGGVYKMCKKDYPDVLEELMPHMCALDHAYAKIMHAKLIRTHTVTTGSDSCDYWYVPDRSATALNFRGKTI